MRWRRRDQVHREKDPLDIDVPIASWEQGWLAAKATIEKRHPSGPTGEGVCAHSTQRSRLRGFARTGTIDGSLHHHAPSWPYYWQHNLRSNQLQNPKLCSHFRDQWYTTCWSAVCKRPLRTCHWDQQSHGKRYDFHKSGNVQKVWKCILCPTHRVGRPAQEWADLA